MGANSVTTSKPRSGALRTNFALFVGPVKSSDARDLAHSSSDFFDFFFTA